MKSWKGVQEERSIHSNLNEVLYCDTYKKKTQTNPVLMSPYTI